ncbi:hypothetical protein NLU13_7826 [Sarocladium strictum]|uniref:FAD-binding PCMH-type domain-containing protein n=1 Tax=Sarocladium strictum TaxID=5046 RepID=A0AA39GDJ5_SARSR|nr:hypothetical protein NLU13_7826 [Sarocladium strictum]
MGSLGVSNINDVEAFFAKHPHIPFLTPSSPGYRELRAAYIKDSPTTPLGIARPRTAEDVAAIVTFATAKGVQFSVRTGGHDLFGRSFVDGALAIDMRDLAYVQLGDDRETARIGGGTLAIAVADALSREGVATPLGSFPTVGFVGWATLGGYGPLAPNYGLGVDQIVAARIVNAEGRVVDAVVDVLFALRGGGGALGVVVELTVKVYPLKNVLAGMILFRSADVNSTLRGFLGHLNAMRDQGLPPQLGIQPSVVNTPQGKSLVVAFMWSSDDLETGHAYLKHITDFGPVLHHDVAAKSIAQWLTISGEVPPSSCYGATCSVRVRKQSDEVVAVLTRMLDSMPDDPAALLCVHEVRGPSAQSRDDSVFAAREAHFLIECIGTASTPGRAEETWTWALQLKNALRQTSKGNLLPGDYVSLTPPSQLNYAEVYGEHWPRFKDIKARYDPRNVFRNAIVKF